MFCFRYRKLLMPYSERLLPEKTRERVRRHLESCDCCLQELRMITSAARALKTAQIPAMEPSSDMWNRIKAQIDPQPRATAVPLWRVRNFQAASAALVGATLLLFVFIKPDYQPQATDVSDRFSVESPAVVDEIQPLTRETPEPAATQDQPVPAKPPTDLKFGKDAAGPTRSVEAYPPSASYQAPGLSPAYDDGVVSAEPRPLPPSAPSQTQGVPGGSQIAGLGSPVSNVEGGGLKNSPPNQVPEAEPIADQAKIASTPRSDVRGGGAWSTQHPGASSPGPDVALQGSPRTRQPESLSLGTTDMEKLRNLRTEYTRKLQQNPNDIPTIQQLAEVEKQLGNKAAAVAHRKKLTELQPREASRWIDLGDAYSANSQPVLASEAYRKALRIGLPREQAIEVNRKLQRLNS